MGTLYICMLVLCVVYLVTPSDARKVRSNCRGVWCEAARCIDSVMDEDACCFICPSGENCILFGDVILANQVTVNRVGQCEWTCRCPGSYAYEHDRPNTVATCHMVCQGSYISNEEIQESYNLLEPMKRELQEASRARDVKKSLVRDVLQRRFNAAEKHRWA